MKTKYKGNIKSDFLYDLRQIVNKIKPLKQLIGDIDRFCLVIDTNVILRDLIWLIKKRKNPEAKTRVQECILAGTFIVYSTKTVIKEVEKKLKKIAVQYDISLDSLEKEWLNYKLLLIIREPEDNLINKYRQGRDPDDAPTLALAKMLNAYGIISKDKDIESMGGKTVSFIFCASARSYSRKATVTVLIKIAGYFTFVIGMELLSALLSLLKNILDKLLNLPGWIKLLLVIAGILVLCIPKFRKFVIDMVKSMSSELQKIMPLLIEFLTQIFEILKENIPVSPDIAK